MFIEKARKLAYNRTSWQSQWQWSLRVFKWTTHSLEELCNAWETLWSLYCVMESPSKNFLVL